MSFTKGEGHATDIAQPSIQIIKKGNDMNGIDYTEFISKKKQLLGSFGFEPNFMPESAFDFQKYIIEKAVNKGRVGIFADTGPVSYTHLTQCVDYCKRNLHKTYKYF